jgi:outer membrane biosynthesis protein TonB
MLPIILALLVQATAGAARIPARLLSVVPPNPPLNVIAGGCVLQDVTVDLQGKVGNIAILEGMPPFNDSATLAVREWKFIPESLDGRSVASRIGVLTMFRPAALGNFGVGGPSFGYNEPALPKGNHPPLALAVTDPGYPQMSIGAGVVIIELTIDRNGIPSNIRTVQDVPSLTQLSRDAVRSWRFAPAMESGEPVNGRLVIAISFLRPL